MMRRSIPVIEGRGKREPITQERKDVLYYNFALFFSRLEVETRLQFKREYLDCWSPNTQNSVLKEKFQPLLNQLLKFYAERLNDAVRVDEEFMKKMSAIKLSELRNSYSEKDVQNLVSQVRKQLEDIREAKKKFWELHDTVRDLGFETWGDTSYKTYIYLKPE
jgi:hypothetical protein